MSACAAVLAAAGLLLAAPDAPPKVVVLVYGEGQEPGALQRQLEADLIAKGAQVITVTRLVEIAGAAAEATPIVTPPGVQIATDSIKAAEAAFLNGEIEVTKTSAEQAKKALAGVALDVGFDQRVAATLWLAAAHKQLGDLKAAASEVRELLYDLDPAVKVSTDVFLPDFVTYVEEERRKLKSTRVRVTEIPDSASISINGRLATSTTLQVVQQPAGKSNKITIKAPGYRTVEITLATTPPEVLKVPMAFAPRADVDAALRAIFAGKADGGHHSAIRSFVGRREIDAEAAVVAQPQKSGASRVVLWRGGELSPVRDAAEIMGLLRTRETDLLVTTAGIEVSYWQRKLGNLIDLPLTGTGPRVTADVNWNNLLVGADVSYISYGMTEIDASVDGGPTQPKPKTQTGGSAIRAALGVGYGLRFGSDFGLGFLVGGRYESYTMAEPVEVRTSTGTEPLVGSHTWTSPEARLRFVYDGEPVRVHAIAGAAFGGSYEEDPADISGRKPAPGVSPFWQLGASTALGRRPLTVGLLYSGEIRSIEFEGSPRVDQDGTSDEDLSLNDFVTAFSLTAAYRF